jgi:peroxiredoxin
MTIAFFVVAGLVLLVAAAAGWLAYQTLLQNGRMLVRLEKLEQETRMVRAALEEAVESAREHAIEESDAVEPIAGWASGTVVPDFELATADGDTLTLWEWRGRDVVLLFFDPACAHSRELLARMERLRPDESGTVRLLIGTGSVESNRALVENHNLEMPLLVQDEREVARLLRADGTPAAYRIDRLGRTVGDRALGVAECMELLRHSMFGPAEAPRAGASELDFTPLNFPPTPTRTRLRRDGLRPGEAAPAFRLPGLDGDEHALVDYAGKPVLLVFTDPTCAPCHAALPHLERLHRDRANDLQVVAISRGKRESNLEHAREVTFPMLLQRHWEVSKDYAMFATPIAYLIDEHGTIRSRPAVGGQAILDLAKTWKAALPTPAGSVAAVS